MHPPTAPPHSTAPSPPEHPAHRSVVTAMPRLASRVLRRPRSLPTMGLLLCLGLLLGNALGLQPSLAGFRDRGLVFTGALITLTGAAVYFLWKVPERQAARRGGEEGVGTKELFEIENAARATLGQIMSGFAVLVGLLVGWQQLGNTSETLRVSQEGQITDRFTRAVEQLASDELTVRLGGIYALERIAADSARDQGPVMEVLTAFARKEAQPRAIASAETATPAALPSVPAPDVQAVLTVIGRRKASRDGSRCLDLSGANLSGADLFGANLTGICLRNTDLAGAVLSEANLSGANLDGANLVEANLGNANLTGASLSGADLTAANLSRSDFTAANLLATTFSGAILEEANLRGAMLLGADLGGAMLFGADLTDADLADANLAETMLSDAHLAGSLHLTQQQIDAAVTNDQTELPANVLAHPDY